MFLIHSLHIALVLDADWKAKDVPDFIISKNNRLESSGGFLPPQRPGVAGMLAGVVAFLTVGNRRSSDSPDDLVLNTTIYPDWAGFTLRASSNCIS